MRADGGAEARGDVIGENEALTFVVDVRAVIPATDPANAPTEPGVPASEGATEVTTVDLDADMQRPDDDIGKTCKHLARLHRRHRPRQNAGADEKHLQQRGEARGHCRRECIKTRSPAGFLCSVSTDVSVLVSRRRRS